MKLTRRLVEKSCQRKRGTRIPYTFRTRYLGGNRFATTACPVTAITRANFKWKKKKTRKRGKKKKSNIKQLSAKKYSKTKLNYIWWAIFFFLKKKVNSQSWVASFLQANTHNLYRHPLFWAAQCIYIDTNIEEQNDDERGQSGRIPRDLKSFWLCDMVGGGSLRCNIYNIPPSWNVVRVQFHQKNPCSCVWPDGLILHAVHIMMGRDGGKKSGGRARTWHAKSVPELYSSAGQLETGVCCIY